jgi:hypothetical protein
MQNYMSRFRLPNGKWAYIQHDGLANSARQHIVRIRDLWNAPEYFFHLRSGGHVAALRLHQRNSWYGKIDLSSFFSNVTRYRLTRSLKRIGYSFRDADDFAVASTVCVNQEPRRFALPYGFVQSPLLASVALDRSALGKCFRRIHSGGHTLSVYVDDIIVSANTESNVEEALSMIRTAAQNTWFPINEKKSRGPSTELRAFNINMGTEEMEISAERFEEMCQEILINGVSQVSQGILGYVRSVSNAQAEQMLRDFPRSFPTATRLDIVP